MGPNKQPFLGIYRVTRGDLLRERCGCGRSQGAADCAAGTRVVVQAPPQNFDPTDCQANYPPARGYISQAYEMAVTSPDYHKEGEDARQVQAPNGRLYAPGLRPNARRPRRRQPHPPLERYRPRCGIPQHRIIGGTWCGSRHDEDQLWTNRPSRSWLATARPSRACTTPSDIGTSGRVC